MQYSTLVRAELDLQCSYASMYQDFENALRLIDTGDVDAETFIDDRFSLLDADEAFETFVSGGPPASPSSTSPNCVPDSAGDQFPYRHATTADTRGFYSPLAVS